jgi:hypothetical protein
MTQIAKKLELEIERDVAELEHARDEIALKIHLAGMDARTTWNELQKKMALLEERMNQEGAHLKDTTKALAKDIKESLHELKSRL